jgi:hypothetical protein
MKCRILEQLQKVKGKYRHKGNYIRELALSFSIILKSEPFYHLELNPMQSHTFYGIIYPIQFQNALPIITLSIAKVFF